jgi:hypothetical protein
MPVRAREIERAHREVVHVDLQPERDHAGARELDHLARPPHRAALLETALDEQVEPDQLRDEARDGGLVQPRLERDRRPRARAVLRQVPEHHAKVVPANRTLIREPGTLHSPTLTS